MPVCYPPPDAGRRVQGLMADLKPWVSQLGAPQPQLLQPHTTVDVLLGAGASQRLAARGSTELYAPCSLNHNIGPARQSGQS